MYQTRAYFLEVTSGMLPVVVKALYVSVKTQFKRRHSITLFIFPGYSVSTLHPQVFPLSLFKHIILFPYAGPAHHQSFSQDAKTQPFPPYYQFVYYPQRRILSISDQREKAYPVVQCLDPLMVLVKFSINR